jgi:SAM-dependent methyltransferase
MMVTKDPPTRRGLRSKLAKLKYAAKLKADAYVGKYRCSVCGHRVSSFLPIDAELLNNLRLHGWKYLPIESETCNHESYLCPHCGATDRERLYALYLSGYFSTLTPNGALKVVDFAPSPPLSAFIKKLITRTPYSVSYSTADLLRPDVDENVDITDLNLYADGSVDFFICSHVLEHVEDDKKALRELYRILRSGARGILIVPIILTIDEIDEDPSVTEPAERWRRFGQSDHVRLYSRQGFLSRVEQAGFTIYQLGSEHFGKEIFSKHGITDQSVLYVVEKP